MTTIYTIDTGRETFETSETEVAQRYAAMARVTAITERDGEQA